MTARAYVVKPVKETAYPSGPWVGMNDATQPVAADPTRATLLENMWTRDTPHAPFADGRPGFSVMGIKQGSSNNLLLQSEALATSPWTMVNGATVTANTDTAPDGTATADTITGVNATSEIKQNFTVTHNGDYTFSVYLKQGTATLNFIQWNGLGSGAGGALVTVTWVAGVPVLACLSGASRGAVLPVEAVANSFYRCSFVVYNVFSSVTNSVIIEPDTSHSGTGLTLKAWGAQATEGSSVLTYEKTTSALNTPANTSQRHYQFTKLDGTESTIWFIGGKLLKYDWNTLTWSEPVTTANLTTASITLSATARVYCCTFANTLVVSDGVNKPWTWDGTSGAGGLVSLTNAPVIFGQPVIYYAKLFGIKNTERNTLVWSEEGDPTTGYEAGGFNNAWTLGQTDQEGFNALAATDNALTCFRDQSITQVSGTVTSDFSSTGTRDAVSQKVGCASPAAVLVSENTIYFPGSDRRFYKIVGSQIQEIAVGARATFGGCSRTNLLNAVAAPWVEGGLLLFGAPESSQTYPNLFFAINPENDELAGLWRGWLGNTLDAVKNGSSVGVVVHGGGSDSTTATGTHAGYAYLHGNPDGTVWDDFFALSTVAISHRLSLGFVGFDVRTTKQFHQVDVSLMTPTDITAVTFTTNTPLGAGASTLSVAVAGSGQTEWDNFNWDEANWAAASGEQHIACGLKAIGRWLTLTLGHTTIGERFQVQSAVVRAFLLDQRARMN